jgi:aryl-alcohol dehydrogenase-like predicted oxidoreductase
MPNKNKLALGTVQFGLDYGISNFNGKPPLNEISNILNFAHECGIDILDTANGYGNAEKVIGALDAKRFEIVTKFLPESTNGLFEDQFEGSLEKLRINQVYGLLAHRPLDVVDNPHIWDKMLAQKENQKVKKIGFSFDSPEEYDAVSKSAFLPDLVQVPFSYFDDRFIEIIKELKKRGCEIHVRSVFLQGLFFADTNQLSSFFDEVKELIQELQKAHGQTLSTSLLNFVLDHDYIDKVVIGVQSKIQLQNTFDSNLKAHKLGGLTKKINNKILQPSLWP